MDDKIITTSYDNHSNLLSRWLRILFASQLLAAVILGVSAFPGAIGITTWISRVISIAVIFVLFQIVPVHAGYRKAAILQCVSVIGGTVSTLLNINLFATVFSICTIIATYQEFSAHSEITANKDKKLSNRWHSLFYWQMGVGILVGLFSTAGIAIGVFSGVDTDTITNVVLAVGTTISLFVQVFYLIYLKKTLSSFASGRDAD